jgi:hypothetical protein
VDRAHFEEMRLDMTVSSIIDVSNAAQLQAALATAHSGETILLASGNYGSLKIYDQNFSGSGITIAAASATAKPVITMLNINQSSGLNFSGIALDGSSSTASYANTVLNSSNVSFTDLNVHGNLVSGGISIRNSNGIVITNSNFHNLANGIAELDNTNISITKNAFYNIGCDGIDNASATNVSISNNTFTNFYGGSPNNHPDAIQFWTTNTNVSSSNINISDNSITVGSGAQVQGIFMTDQVGNLPYENVNISGNTVIGESWNGIYIARGQAVTLNNNTVIGLNDSSITLQTPGYFGVATTSGIALQGINGLNLSGNNSSTYNFSSDNNVQLSANSINGILQQKIIYSSIGGTLTTMENELILTGNQVVWGTAGAAGQTIIANNAGDRLYDGPSGNDILIGGSGNDTLIARNASDVLSGEGGNNNFQVSNKSGNVTITDFNIGGSHNTLNISALLSGGAHPILSQSGENTIISFSSGAETITLLGVHDTQLVASSTGFHL